MFYRPRKLSKVVPFYHSKKVKSGQQEITTILHVSMDRWTNFLNVCENLNTSVSAAFHVHASHIEDPRAVAALRQLRKKIEENQELFDARIDIHLIIDEFPRQFNYWRNVARLYARSDYIFMLDVDFAIMSPIESIVHDELLLNMLKDGGTALLLPALEFAGAAKSTGIEDFPRTKMEVQKLFKAKKLMLFHGNTNAGHKCIKLGKWMSSTEMYDLPCWEAPFEPYGIFNRKAAPWCDERFVGYGRNKASCWFEMYLAGIQMKVLPDHYAIHQYHPYPLETRKKEVRKALPLTCAAAQERCPLSNLPDGGVLEVRGELAGAKSWQEFSRVATFSSSV